MLKSEITRWLGHHMLQALLAVGGERDVLDADFLQPVAHEHSARRRVVHNEDF